MALSPLQSSKVITLRESYAVFSKDNLAFFLLKRAVENPFGDFV